MPMRTLKNPAEFCHEISDLIEGSYLNIESGGKPPKSVTKSPGKHLYNWKPVKFDLPWLKHWDRFILVVLFVQFWMAPIAAGWSCHFADEEHFHLVIFLHILDLFTCADVLLEAHREYKNEYGIIVTSRTAIRKLFHSKFGGLRLLCSVPWDVIIIGIAYGRNTCDPRQLEIWDAWAFVRFARLVCMTKLWVWWNNYHFPHMHTSASRFIKNILVTVVAAHISGCIFWIVNAFENDVQRWVTREGLDDAAFTVQYINSIWAAERLIFFISRDPDTLVERVYEIFELLWAAAIGGAILGNIQNLIRHFDETEATQEEVEKQVWRQNAIRRYMQEKGFPIELQKRILQQEQYNFLLTQGIDEMDLFSNQPKSMRQEIKNFLYMDLVSHFKLFQGMDDATKNMITMTLKPVNVLKGNVVFRAGDDANEMYFIRRGKVEVLSPDLSVSYAILGPGDCFGEIALIENCHRTATVRALERTDLAMLTIEDFAVILEANPSCLAEFAKLAEERLARAVSQSRESMDRVDLPPEDLGKKSKSFFGMFRTGSLTASFNNAKKPLKTGTQTVTEKPDVASGKSNPPRMPTDRRFSLSQYHYQISSSPNGGASVGTSLLGAVPMLSASDLTTQKGLQVPQISLSSFDQKPRAATHLVPPNISSSPNLLPVQTAAHVTIVENTATKEDSATSLKQSVDNPEVLVPQAPEGKEEEQQGLIPSPQQKLENTPSAVSVGAWSHNNSGSFDVLSASLCARGPHTKLKPYSSIDIGETMARMKLIAENSRSSSNRALPNPLSREPSAIKSELARTASLLRQATIKSDPAVTAHHPLRVVQSYGSTPSVDSGSISTFHSVPTSQNNVSGNIISSTGDATQDLEQVQPVIKQNIVANVQEPVRSPEAEPTPSEAAPTHSVPVHEHHEDTLPNVTLPNEIGGGPSRKRYLAGYAPYVHSVPTRLSLRRSIDTVRREYLSGDFAHHHNPHYHRIIKSNYMESDGHMSARVSPPETSSHHSSARLSDYYVDSLTIPRPKSRLSQLGPGNDPGASRDKIDEVEGVNEGHVVAPSHGDVQVENTSVTDDSNDDKTKFVAKTL